MKKRLLSVLMVVLVLLAFSFSLAQMPPQQQMKPEEVKRALNLVSKTEPVPEKYKVGLSPSRPKTCWPC